MTKNRRADIVMKKLFVILLTIVAVLTLAVSAVADNGGFVESPSNNDTPEVVDSSNESEDCDAEIVIYSYSDRSKLSEDKQKAIEEAYGDIVATSDVSSLNAEIGQLTDELGINADELAVSELFYVAHTDCDGHEAHGEFTVEIDPKVTENFVGVVYFAGGSWHLLDFARISTHGESIVIKLALNAPYAILVYTGEEEFESPSMADVEEPKDNGTVVTVVVAVAVAVAAVIAVAGVVIALSVIKKKKK